MWSEGFQKEKYVHTSQSFNLPGRLGLAESRIIIYLYLNTHKAYTGKGTTTQGRKKVIQSRWR